MNHINIDYLSRITLNKSMKLNYQLWIYKHNNL